MSIPLKINMYNLTNFSMSDMTECSSFLRNVKKGSANMEESGNKIVRYLYEKFIADDGGKAFVLVRLFITVPFSILPNELKAFAEKFMEEKTEPANVPCLTLISSYGSNEEWHSRLNSREHKSIPLENKERIKKMPMISSLFEQFGLELNQETKPDRKILLDDKLSTYNVFHVPNARGCSLIPKQREFVIPENINSVLGFGGKLSFGNLFAIIIFSRQKISKETANRFKPLALSVRASLLPFEFNIFSEGQPNVF